MHIMYDSSFSDMCNIEQEMLKIGSYYINKIEPLLDTDLKNIFPSVDRFSLLANIIELENEY